MCDFSLDSNRVAATSGTWPTTYAVPVSFTPGSGILETSLYYGYQSNPEEVER